ncbi:MAG: glycerate kinase [Gemmatimonadota bacterium]
MRVLVCPTAFKESMSARQVTRAMVEGVSRALPGEAIQRMPVSDGGPGLIDAIAAVDGGERREHAVTGPLGGQITARSLWTPTGEAVIEAADACGLHLMDPADRHPLRAHTLGVGELVMRCLEHGPSAVVLGLGGSGTVDGGTGLARALGYRFLNSEGSDLPPGGGALRDLARIECVSGRPDSTTHAAVPVTAIADVRSPLLGPDGAARRFAPQKGASQDEVETLETGLERLAERLAEDLARDVADLPGAGAAGGLGVGCAAFLDADLVAGSDWVLDRVGFDGALESTDLVVTGEGAWDATSGLGKIVWEIIRRAMAASVPVALVCGRITGQSPAGVTALDGGGEWLDADAVARLVAEVVG